MFLLKQSSTQQALVFFMYDSGDHVTGKTGLSPTVVIRKEGGSFASPSGSVTEIANGYYQVAGNATDTATLGSLILSATASGADQATMGYEVVGFDPFNANNLGLASIPSVAPGAANGLLIAGSNAATTLDSLTVTNDLNITGSFSASTIGIGSGVTIGGNLQINGAFAVAGSTTWTGPVTFSGGLTAGNIVADITGNITGTLSTLTTYTGNTPQTGDSYARIGATGSGLTSLAPSATALSTAVWTGALATAIGVTNAQVLFIPRRGAGSFIHTNVSTAATATVAIT